MKWWWRAALSHSQAVKLRFLLVGGSVTLFDIGLCTILTQMVPPNLAYCLSFATAVALRFWLDKHFTFRSSGGQALAQFAKYWLSCSLTMLVGIVAFNALRGCGLPLIVAKIVSVIPVTLLGYVLFRFFVFGRQPEGEVSAVGADRA